MEHFIADLKGENSKRWGKSKLHFLFGAERGEKGVSGVANVGAW